MTKRYELFDPLGVPIYLDLSWSRIMSIAFIIRGQSRHAAPPGTGRSIETKNDGVSHRRSVGTHLVTACRTPRAGFARIRTSPRRQNSGEPRYGKVTRDNFLIAIDRRDGRFEATLVQLQHRTSCFQSFMYRNVDQIGLGILVKLDFLLVAIEAS